MITTWSYAGTLCKVKEDWADAGRQGEALCYFQHNKLGQTWVLVVWDDEDDPDCFKAAGLLVKRQPWNPNSKWEEVESVTGK